MFKTYHPIGRHLPLVRTVIQIEGVTTGSRPPHGYAHHRHEVSDQRDAAMPGHPGLLCHIPFSSRYLIVSIHI